MLLWGTVNPEGEDDNYKGFFFTKKDLQKCITNNEIVGKPVKIEHKGINIGQVVSSWLNRKGQMDCVLEVDENLFEGAVISGFMKQGLCGELSLGYIVDVKNSATGTITVHGKAVVEVSIVKRGARDKCKIHGFGNAF